MERIFLILLLYVIFGVIGPLIKRMQRRQQQLPTNTPPGTPAGLQRTPQQTGEATYVEKHFTRLQDAFQQPPELPPAIQEAQSAFSEEKKVLELLPPPLQTKSRVSTTYRPPVARRKTATSAPQKTSLLGLDQRRGYMQGIIMAEILGPPVSKRR